MTTPAPQPVSRPAPQQPARTSVAGWSVAGGGTIGVGALLMWLLSTVNGLSSDVGATKATVREQAARVEHLEQTLQGLGVSLHRIERKVDRITDRLGER